MSTEASSTERPFNPLAILLHLRWTLLLRTYSRSRKNLVGLALTALFFGPISVFLAVLIYEFGHDSAQVAPLVSRAALAIIYGLWIAAPLLGFPLNESNDPSRLFVYPVSLRTILIAGILGSVIEPATLLAVPVCVAVALLFCHSVLSSVVAFLAVGLFMLHTLAVAQLLLLSLIGLLRSRQFRDVTIVLLPLVAVGAYIGQQALARGLIGSGAVGTISHLAIWRVADWLPPGWAVHACIDAAGGRIASALALLLALAVVVVIPFPLAAAALGRLYSGERGSTPDAACSRNSRLTHASNARTSPKAASAEGAVRPRGDCRWPSRCFASRIRRSSLNPKPRDGEMIGPGRYGPADFRPGGLDPDWRAMRAQLHPAALRRGHADAALCRGLSRARAARFSIPERQSPGLRALQKYAVRCGGGTNQPLRPVRPCFSSRTITSLSWGARGRRWPRPCAALVRFSRTPRVEVEVDRVDQIAEVLAQNVDQILLDNMTLEEMREAVSLIAGCAKTEASGNMTLDRVRDVAATGVDFISVGALTHECARHRLQPGDADLVPLRAGPSVMLHRISVDQPALLSLTFPLAQCSRSA